MFAFAYRLSACCRASWIGFLVLPIVAGCGGGGSASGTGTATVLKSVVIHPDAPVTGVGLTRQLSATGTYSDGKTADVTGQATWSSTVPAIASIAGSSGLVTGVSLGTTIITVNVGSVSNSVPLKVISGVWTPAANAMVGHAYHTATLLRDGRILIVGGQTAAVEIYDPVADSWTSAASLTGPLSGHTATLLADGTVLVTGGFDPSTPVFYNQVEIYDPVTNNWTQGPQMQVPHAYHTATVLNNGKVLVVGGTGGNSFNAPTDVVEIYDPVGKSWSSAAVLPQSRTMHTATLLPSGKVLVAGGATSIDPVAVWASNAVIYDPASNQWSSTGALVMPRIRHSAMLLPSGQVLLAGGQDVTGHILTSVESYDPLTNAWSAMPNLGLGRELATGIAMPGGKILLVGGLSECAPSCPPGTLAIPTATSELLDPVTDTWTQTARLNQARSAHTGTLTAQGVVVVVGGYGPIAGNPFAVDLTASAELYW